MPNKFELQRAIRIELAKASFERGLATGSFDPAWKPLSPEQILAAPHGGSSFFSDVGNVLRGGAPIVLGAIGGPAAFVSGIATARKRMQTRPPRISISAFYLGAIARQRARAAATARGRGGPYRGSYAQYRSYSRSVIQPPTHPNPKPTLYRTAVTVAPAFMRRIPLGDFI